MEAPDKVFLKLCVSSIICPTAGDSQERSSDPSTSLRAYRTRAKMMSMEIRLIVQDATLRFMVKLCSEYSKCGVNFTKHIKPKVSSSNVLNAPVSIDILIIPPITAFNLNSCTPLLQEAEGELQRLLEIQDGMESADLPSCPMPQIQLIAVPGQQQGPRAGSEIVQVKFLWRIFVNLPDQAPKVIATLHSHVFVGEGFGIEVGPDSSGESELFFPVDSDMSTWKSSVTPNGFFSLLCQEHDDSLKGFSSVYSSIPLNGMGILESIEKAPFELSLSGVSLPSQSFHSKEDG